MDPLGDRGKTPIFGNGARHSDPGQGFSNAVQVLAAAPCPQGTSFGHSGSLASSPGFIRSRSLLSGSNSRNPGLTLDRLAGSLSGRHMMWLAGPHDKPGSGIERSICTSAAARCRIGGGAQIDCVPCSCRALITQRETEQQASRSPIAEHRSANSGAGRKGDPAIDPRSRDPLKSVLPRLLLRALQSCTQWLAPAASVERIGHQAVPIDDPAAGLSTARARFRLLCALAVLTRKAARMIV